MAGAVIGGLSVAGTIGLGLAPVRESCAQTAQQQKPAPREQQGRQVTSYAEDIVPIFRGYCVSCHQPGGEGLNASGFDLTSYEGLMKGTKFGPMVIPREPDTSNLVILIEGRAAKEMRMPHGQKPLPACLRQEIWTWIFQGAKNN
jgi:hypothetical protein